MAQLLTLYFDTLSKQLVFSETDPTPQRLPIFYQEDIVPIQFIGLRRISQFAEPIFQRLNTSAYPLVISVGTANNVLASQNTWTANEDNTLLTGSLNLNTAGITALTDGYEVITEIQLGDYRGQFTTTVKKSVRISSSLVMPAGDRALGALEAARTYVRKQGLAGEGMIFTSADGLSQVILYLHNDKSFRTEEIA